MLAFWPFQTSPSVWTRAGILADKRAPLWVLFATLPVSLNLSIRLLMVLWCWIFLPGIFCDEITLGQEQLILLQSSRIWVRSWTENCYSASVLVSDEPCSYTLWLTWKWKWNVNFFGIYKLLKSTFFFSFCATDFIMMDTWTLMRNMYLPANSKWFIPIKWHRLVFDGPAYTGQVA